MLCHLQLAGIMARGRTKGASDKVPRKLRGGGARKAAVTEGPIFASSNNRRGIDTAMQRTFAAHLTIDQWIFEKNSFNKTGC